MRFVTNSTAHAHETRGIVSHKRKRRNFKNFRLTVHCWTRGRDRKPMTVLTYINDNSIWIFFKIFTQIELVKFFCEASRGTAAQSVTVKATGCGFNSHSGRWNIYLNLYFHFFALVSRLSAALRSATQHAIPPEFGRKWGTECFNTRFPLPTLLCAGYSVKPIYLFFYFYLLAF